MVSRLRTRIHSQLSPLVIAGMLAVLVALLWLPFGLNIGFVGDGWIYFHQADAGIAMMAASPLRLFLPVPWILAYSLIPGTFTGINLFLALLIFGKSLLLYAILRRLSIASALAFAAAALVIVLPADTGIFYLGALAIHFALFCYLLALYLLVIYWQSSRFSALLAMWIALIFCVGIYELVYPLILFSPLVLLLRSKVNRRFVFTTLLWYLVPALNAGWYVWIVLTFPRALQYQTSLVVSTSPLAILTSLFNIYRRHFWDGWLQASSPAGEFWLWGIFGGILAGGVCLWLARRDRSTSKLVRRLPVILVLAGLLIVGLGVAVYLPTSVRDDTLRTFYFSSVGAALALAAVFWWQGRHVVIFGSLVGLLVGVGTYQLLGQHQRFVDQSEYQQGVLTDLIQALPAVAPGTGIVVVDESPDRAFVHAIRSSFYLEYTLPLLYHDYSVDAEVCGPGEFGTGDEARCRFTDDGMVIPSVRTFFFRRLYSQLIFVRYDGVFSVVSDLTPYAGVPVPDYQPARLYDPLAPLPSRVTELFSD